METSADILREIAGARVRETQILIIELCGVFWIAAELVILFFVMEARRHLGRSPIPAKPVWDGIATRRAAIFLLLMTAALLAAVVRPALWVPLSALLQQGPLDVRTTAMHDFHAVLRHLVLWAFFVTMWVVLEGAIVCQGYRAYRVLRSRILDGPVGPRPFQGVQRPVLRTLLLGTGLALGLMAAPAFAAQTVAAPSAAAANSWAQVIQMSEGWLAPYRNAMYLYLRLAGVVWITVEWIAALILWRASLLVGRALTNRGSLA